MGSGPMTIVVSSYQRRGPLLRLLRALDEQVARSEELRATTSVVVVLDGSTDGSREAIEAEIWNLPVRVVWQPNRGLAAARNAGLAAAGDGLVWFLDDDLVPTPGLVERHHRAHREHPASVVMGRCRIPEGSGAPQPFLEWWDAFYDGMDDGDPITRFDQFTAANTSAPSALLAAVGGFDESFATYGMEDFELAIRLIGAGTPILFDGEAVVWHPDIPDRGLMITRERSTGCNAARIATLHPDVADDLFPSVAPSAPRRLIRLSRIRRPRSLMLLSQVCWGVSRGARRIDGGVAQRAEHLAHAAARAAGVAEGDPSGALLHRVLEAA